MAATGAPPSGNPGPLSGPNEPFPGPQPPGTPAETDPNEQPPDEGE